MGIQFKQFKEEIKKHEEGGYHSLTSAIADTSLWIELKEELNPSYTEFLTHIGAGSFYAGKLQLFTVGDHSFKQFNSDIQAAGYSDYIAIGYDGTTEGCFCLRKDNLDTSVYWFNYPAQEVSVIYKDFSHWIEHTPQDMFNESIFNAYRDIKDTKGVKQVINEREKFIVSLKNYEKELVAHPSTEKQYLKRYNKITFEVGKKEPSSLQELTIKMMRTGSSVGENNVEYVTVNVSAIRSGETKEVEALLFDPFNLPFDDIICLFNPEIDLGSKMKVKYKEIVSYL